MLDYQNSTALITGASGGLGEAFAEQLAARGANLVLAGRSQQKVEPIARRIEQQYKIQATALTADFALPGAAEELIGEIRRRGIEIDLLVNNAGFGVFEQFFAAPLDRQMEQIDVNVKALVTLTHAFVPAMVERGRGAAINVASIAAFQPLASANIYAASKSFVLFFSQALAREIAWSGVRVLAVCPGPVATQFYADKAPTLARNKMDTPQQVVRESLLALEKNKRVVIPGKLSGRLGAFAVRLLPGNLVAKIAESKVRQLNHR